MTEKAREQRLRRLAKRNGYLIHKDRSRNWSFGRQGGWMIVNPQYNFVVRGSRFELDLDDVEEFFSKA